MGPGSTARRDQPDNRDRRVRKTQAALREAFVALVVERGYDAVTVEDIVARADVARATFYGHFADKEALLAALFEELTGELTSRVAAAAGAPTAVRTDLVRQLYEHAEELRDLYLVCLRGAGNGRARAAYVDVVAGAAETLFGERLHASMAEPRVPLPELGRAFAGAHLVLLQAWLEQDSRIRLDDAVRAQMELLTNGFAWALGMLPEELAVAFPDV